MRVWRGEGPVPHCACPPERTRGLAEIVPVPHPARTLSNWARVRCVRAERWQSRGMFPHHAMSRSSFLSAQVESLGNAANEHLAPRSRGPHDSRRCVEASRECRLARASLHRRSRMSFAFVLQTGAMRASSSCLTAGLEMARHSATAMSRLSGSRDFGGLPGLQWLPEAVPAGQSRSEKAARRLVRATPAG